MNPAALLLFAMAGAAAVAVALRRDPGSVAAVDVESAPIGTVADPDFAAPNVFEVFTAAVNNTLKKIFTLPPAAAPYADAIRAAEVKYQLPDSLLARVLYQESRFRPDVISGRTSSSAGAQGIAQFMPGTAADLGIDPLDPFQAIPAAGKYLRQLFNQLGSWDRALAAYNWGIGNVQRRGLDAAPLETRNYVNQVLADVAA